MNQRRVRRIFREWVLPLAVGAGLVAIAVVFEIPPRWGYITWIVVAVGFATTLWILSGGTVIEIATWLIPTLVLVSAHLLYPTIPGILAVGFVLLVPVASGLTPIGRAFGWYLTRMTGWIVPLSLPMRDRAASAELQRALIPDPSFRDGTLPMDDRASVASAVRAHAERVRTVRAPDLGWMRLARKFASSLEAHADYVDGRGRDDDEEAIAMLADARKEWRQLLRSRSIGYRILTHRFVPQKQDPDR